MKVISFNANGIRSAAKKGFYEWLQVEDPDFVCIQETKAQVEQLVANGQFFPAGYHCEYVDAIKKGYSGVALYAKEKPLHIERSLGWSIADEEGRYIRFDYPKLSIASIYFPSGTSGEGRQGVKQAFLEQFSSHLEALKQEDKALILCGDYNIAHKNIDIKNWKANQKNSGFLPEERAYMDDLFGASECVDAFRAVNQNPDEYSWWSSRGQARAKNVGWRIDYQVVTKSLCAQIRHARIYRDVFFSDHAPLIVEYAGGVND